MSENSTRKQRGRPFSKGQSGNPRGKPKGAVNRSTRAVLALLDGEAEALTRKAVAMALAGDTTALRLCLDRLAPPAKDRPVSIALPALTDSGGAAQVMGAVVAALSSGEITPSEAGTIAGVIEAYRHTLESTELERRIAELEKKEQPQ